MTDWTDETRARIQAKLAEAREALAEAEKTHMEYIRRWNAEETRADTAEAEVDRLKGYMTPGQVEADSHIKDLLERWKESKAEVERLRGWLLSHHPDRPPLWDHACAECVPGGPIVKPGFVCVWHEARAALRGGGK